MGLVNSLTSGDDPVDLLGGFVMNITKATVDFVLEDAEDNKAEFAKKGKEEKISRSVNNVEIDDNKKEDDGGDVKLNKEQKARWENMWMDNLRQQIHLEL